MRGRGRGGGRRRLVVVIGDVLKPPLKQVILLHTLVGCELVQLQDRFA